MTEWNTLHHTKIETLMLLVFVGIIKVVKNPVHP